MLIVISFASNLHIKDIFHNSIISLYLIYLIALNFLNYLCNDTLISFFIIDKLKNIKLFNLFIRIKFDIRLRLFEGNL
jgi:hypothetical protein